MTEGLGPLLRPPGRRWPRDPKAVRSGPVLDAASTRPPEQVLPGHNLDELPATQGDKGGGRLASTRRLAETGGGVVSDMLREIQRGCRRHRRSRRRRYRPRPASPGFPSWKSWGSINLPLTTTPMTPVRHGRAPLPGPPVGLTATVAPAVPTLPTRFPAGYLRRLRMSPPALESHTAAVSCGIDRVGNENSGVAETLRAVGVGTRPAAGEVPPTVALAARSTVRTSPVATSAALSSPKSARVSSLYTAAPPRLWAIGQGYGDYQAGLRIEHRRRRAIAQVDIARGGELDITIAGAWHERRCGLRRSSWW